LLLSEATTPSTTTTTTTTTTTSAPLSASHRQHPRPPPTARNVASSGLRVAVYNAFNKTPGVLSVRPPFARGQTSGQRPIEQQSLSGARILTGRLVGLHCTLKNFKDATDYVPERLRPAYKNYLCGGGEIGGFNLAQDRGHLIGLMLYGNVRRTSDEVLPANEVEWLMRCDSGLEDDSGDMYPYYVEVLASVSFHVPIAHSGSAGYAKRDLTMTETVEIARVLRAGEFTLTSGNIQAFDVNKLKALRMSELKRLKL
jgi:hypothetical protein